MDLMSPESPDTRGLQRTAAGSRPLRIIHILGTSTGAPWVVSLVREQQQLGHEVAVILPSLEGTIAPALAASGIPCHAAKLQILRIRTKRGRVRLVLELAWLLRRLRPDVVHSHLLPAVITSRLASWIADVPIRFAANTGPITLESALLRPVEIGTAFCDTRTIASCSYTRDLFVRYGIPESRTGLMYYTTDQTSFDPATANGSAVRDELGIERDAPLIGIVAYFYKPSPVYDPHLAGGVKGQDVLLRAVPHVLAQFPRARFALVGHGWGTEGEAYVQELKDLARSLGVEHAVVFPGERRDVADTLAAFDISVHPSRNDNLGGTIESLLMARPMVVSDIPGYRDSITHEETGLVVPVGDPRALADGIVRLLRHPELARRLGENGRRRMLDRFTLSRTVADVESMLATETARAENHYRLRTTVVRLLTVPFHLIPMMIAVRRASRSPHPIAEG
jgi:glycosyltransferase involved in cell wall biosynthesis